MMELPESFRNALDEAHGQPLRLVDPRTNETYVLVRADLVEQYGPADADDDDFRGVDVGALIDSAMREEDRDDPLLECYQEPKGPR